MSDIILQTKLNIPPSRPSLVARPHLHEKLNRGLAGKFTLVSAPAGYGKTTLVTEWLSHSQFPNPLWLSLDATDNEPRLLFRYLATAIRPLPDSGQSLAALLEAPYPLSPEALATALINDLAVVEAPFGLILDDYHVIDNAAVDDAFSLILDRMPPAMHLVLISRSDPVLPLARLRARGQLSELRQADLRLSVPEAAVFLNDVMGLNLPDVNVAALEARTEGWIAGLQMAALSLRDRSDTEQFISSFSGSHRYVIDYLTDEVLQQQPPAVQTFLLHTAVLNRLNGPLCDALLAEAALADIAAQEILEQLDRGNLFLVPLDEQRHWYRYHYLFADLLRKRLGRRHPERIAALHRRASDWYAVQGLIEEALAHALHAADYDRAAELVDGLVHGAWERGEHGQLLRWLATLPDEQFARRPRLGVYYAWVLFAGGRQAEAAQRLQAVEQTLAALEPDEPSELAGQVAATRAFMATFTGNLSDTIRFARQALTTLTSRRSTWRGSAAMALADAHGLMGDLATATDFYLEAMTAAQGANRYLTLLAGVKLMMAQRQRGRLPAAAATYNQLSSLLERDGLGETELAGCLYTVWAELLCEWNRLDEAVPLVEKGLALSAAGTHLGLRGWSSLHAARVLLAAGDLTTVETLLAQMSAAPAAQLPPWLESPFAALRGLLWLVQGEPEKAWQWARTRALDAADTLAPGREGEYLVLARVFVANGRYDEASALLHRLDEATRSGGRLARTVAILLLQTAVSLARARPDVARQTLTEALSLAEPGGLVRVFVDAGEPVAGLLREMERRPYVEQILNALAQETNRRTAPATRSDSGQPLTEPLSERELEVLQLIATGCRNKEIASQLVISLNTVLFHTRNIYRKLDATNRTQAAAKARELALLPE